MEAELRGLVLFVTPFRYRYPVEGMAGKRLGRSVTTVLRTADRPLTTDEATDRTAVLGGLVFTDPKEAHAFRTRVRQALERMKRRGVVEVVKREWDSQVWGLAPE